MKKTLNAFLLVLVIASITITSCKKAAPALPPSSTMEIKDIDAPNEKAATIGFQNAVTAALQVGFWTTYLKVILAIPHAAYKHAFNYKPTYLGEYKWVWEYQVQVGNKTYIAQLYGTIPEKDKVRWEMYISNKEGEFSKFLWFYGEHDADQTNGSWVMFKNPNENHELLRIDWTKTAGEKGRVRYTLIEKDNENKDSYITYGNDLDGLYNCFYNIYLSKNKKNVEINYNTSTHIGRIKASHIYFDDLWHCWNENFLDDYCPTTTK